MKRREFIKSFAISTTALAVVPSILSASDKNTTKAEKSPDSPNKMPLDDAIKAITGGKTPEEDKKGIVELEVPDIAENGAVVPAKVSVNHPMDEKNYVKAIHMLAEKNKNSRVANVFLTPANGEAFFSTRIKLGESQHVVVVVELSNGTFIKAQSAKPVKVTIGGCG